MRFRSPASFLYAVGDPRTDPKIQLVYVQSASWKCQEPRKAILKCNAYGTSRTGLQSDLSLWIKGKSGSPRSRAFAVRARPKSCMRSASAYSGHHYLEIGRAHV